MTTNHQWSTADQLLDYPTGDPDTYSVYFSVTDAAYTAPVVDPPPNLAGVRQGFYTFTVTEQTGLSVTVSGFGPAVPVDCGLWTRIGGSWQVIETPPVDPVAATITTNIAAGTYYLMMAFDDETSAQAIELLTWTAVLGEPFETHPPIEVRVTIASADAPASVRVVVGVGAPQDYSGVFTLSAPLDGTVLASATPAFTLAVVSDDDDAVYTVEMQYDDNTGFTSPVVLSKQVSAVDGGAVLTPAAAIPSTTYWRARLLDSVGTVVSGWRSGGTLTVDSTASTVSFPFTWSVNSGAVRRIHLWHVTPDGPVVGELVTVYGQGFPASGHLLLDGDNVTYESWQLVPASSDNTLTARRIDGETVTCEHYEIVFAAPGRETGAILTVEA